VYDKNGRLIGVVGFDISLDEMKANIEATQFLENGYSFLIDQDGHAIALTDQGFRDIMGRSPGEGETDIDVSQTETPFAGTIRKMLAGQGGLDLLNVGGRELIVAYSPLESTGWSLGSVVPSASVLKNIASLQTEVDQTTRSLVLNRLLPVSAAIFLILLGLGAFLTNRMVHPIQKLAAAAQQIGSGNWDVEIPRTREDEIGLLANSFQGMASQLRDLVGTLEERVAERTRDLELRSIQMQTAAEVARDITATQELDTLLDRAVQMICNRFGFYFGAIFLIDDLREYAHLRAVTGQARQEILARRLKLKIGEQGIVGYVAAKGEARIARDVDSDETYYRDPLLADTRSEMALPLRVGRRSIGVLDVQSNVPAAFTQDDITILQTLADQLAVAIENARLLEELQKTVQETNDYYQEQAQKAWLLTARRQQTAFEYDQLRVRPLENKLPPEVMARLQDGHAITLNGDTPGNGHSPTSLVAPVMLRQQVIGVIGLEQDDPHHSWSPEEIAIVEAAASQAAMTLENARLYLESQEKAERERVIGEITEKMQRANDMDTLVARLLQELQQVFDASYAVVHLKQER
jgi:GAF domain-containing protein/HAMP domain-containing protein